MSETHWTKSNWRATPHPNDPVVQIDGASNTGKKYYAENLGCGTVEVDLRKTLKALDAGGYQRCCDASTADVIVIQTCSFLASQATASMEKTEGLLATAAPNARVLVQGCAVDTEGPAFERLRVSDTRLHLHGASVRGPAGDLADRGSVFFREKAGPSVAVRVSRGCASGCSFCSIRLSQGRVKSRSHSEIINAIESASPDEDPLVIHLASEDVGGYGLDIGSTLPRLLEVIVERFSTSTIHLSTISPVWLHRYEADIVRWIKSGTIDKSIYCPAQSGSTRLLRAMRRGYTAELLRDVYDTLFAEIPSLRLYTDFLVGHPGERNRDFVATLELATAYPYEAVSVWAYEERPGTRSAELGDIVLPSVRVDRAKRIADAFVQAHWRRHNLSVSEGIERLLNGRLPVRSNVPLFEVAQLFAIAGGGA